MVKTIRIIKAILPPILWWGFSGFSWKLKYLISNKKPTINGIYSNFSEVKSSKINSFEEKGGQEFALEKIKIIQRETKLENFWSISQKDSTQIDQPGDISLISLVNSLISEGYFVNVIDFGGALGNTYFAQKQKIVNSTFSWNVIERKKLVEIGNQKFKNDKLKFFNDISEISLNSNNSKNVALFRGSLQYFDENDFNNILKKFEEKNIHYVVLSQLLCGFIPDFVAAQNLWNTTTPIRFYNIQTLTKKMENFNFGLIHRCAENELLTMKNYPKKNRLNNLLCLIFRKKS